MSRTSGKNSWALFLMILVGIVLGGFVGNIAKDVSYMSWLNYGNNFGLGGPVKLNLGIIVITFGLSIKVTMASIIGVIIAIIIYKKI